MNYRLLTGIFSLMGLIIIGFEVFSDIGVNKYIITLGYLFVALSALLSLKVESKIEPE